MSTRPDSGGAIPGLKEWNEMAAEYQRMMPKPFPGAANLMVHPAGALAASTAFGFGLAGHALGVWLGAFTGATEAARRMRFLDQADTQPAAGAAEAPAYEAPSSPTVRARAAADTLAADTESAVREAGRAMTEAAANVARGAGEATEAAENAVAPAAKAGTTRQEPARPPSVERPAVPDDLTAIAGIGPKLERTLNDLGVWTHAQIAAWTPAEIAWIDDRLSFPGRIERDGWVAQARNLSGRGT